MKRKRIRRRHGANKKKKNQPQIRRVHGDQATGRLKKRKRKIKKRKLEERKSKKRENRRKELDFKGAIAKRIRLHYPGTFNLLHLTKITPNIHEFYLKVKVKVSVLLKGAIAKRIGLHYPHFWLHMFFPPFVASKRFVSQDSVVRNDFQRVLSKQENNFMVIEVKRTKFVTSIFGRRPAKSL